MASPFYPPYVNIVTARGMQPVIMEAGPETRFQPSVAMLEKLDPKPDGLIVASPCNPVGTMLHPDELAAIARWCHTNGVRLVSDEIYHGLNYESPIATAASFSDSAIVVNSFSKYFSMTGWRIGWTIGPAEVIKAMDNLQSQETSNPCSISQYAAVEALNGPQESVEAMRVEFEKRRDYVMERMLPWRSKFGITFAEPSGAFYAFFNIKAHLGRQYGGVQVNDSAQWCLELLAQKGVACVMGSAFGAEGYARMSFATSLDVLAKGFDQIEAFLKS